MRTKTVKLSQLSQDEQLLYIRGIDRHFVSQYKQNMQNGAVFPPIVVNRKNLQIVSGNHRYHAMLSVYGLEHKVVVITESFKSRSEILAFFTKENVSHGKFLDGFTKKKLIMAMYKEGISYEDIANHLNVHITKINEYSADVVMVQIGDDVQTLPVKEHIEIEAGRVIYELAYRRHEDHDRGISVVQQCMQLYRWLKEGFISTKKQNNIDALKLLYHELGLWLKRNCVE